MLFSIEASNVRLLQSTAVSQFFLAAMVLFPEVQRKAQAELDAHVGPGRLPDFGDYDSLVYVRAVALEALRWNPVAPLGLPHKVAADDEYMGYRIPKGTIVFSVSVSCVSSQTLGTHFTDAEHLVSAMETLPCAEFTYHCVAGLSFTIQMNTQNLRSSALSASSKKEN